MLRYHVYSDVKIDGKQWRSCRGIHVFFYFLGGSLSGRTIDPMLKIAAPSMPDTLLFEDYRFSISELELFRDLLNAWLSERLEGLEIAEENAPAAYKICGKWFYLNTRNRQEGLICAVQDTASEIETCLARDIPLYFSIVEAF